MSNPAQNKDSGTDFLGVNPPRPHFQKCPQALISSSLSLSGTLAAPRAGIQTPGFCQHLIPPESGFSCLNNNSSGTFLWLTFQKKILTQISARLESDSDQSISLQTGNSRGIFLRESPGAGPWGCARATALALLLSWIVDW